MDLCRNKRSSVMLMALITVMLFCSTGVWAEENKFIRVAENKRAILWVDPTTGVCQLTDRETGYLWKGIPDSIDQQNDLWKAIYRSAFMLRYIEGERIGLAYTGQTNCIKTVTPMNSGVRVHFSFASNPRLAFSAEYTLTDSGLRVRIPYQSMEDPENTLLDLRVLPYFGNLNFGTDGYVVLPDGVGGIIHANRRKSLRYLPTRVYGERFFWSAERDRYNQYGSTQRYLNFFDYNDRNTASMSLPIFGVVRGDSAVLGVISEGQFESRIGPEITPDDRVLSVSPQLIYREVTYNIFARLQSGAVFNPIDRIVDYHLLNKEDASYAGMARYYRKMLKEKNGPMSVQRKGYRIRILFAVEEVYKDTRNIRVLTTFDQAEKMLIDLHRRGVRDLEVVLVGWTKRGLLGANPQHFPVERRLGGKAGLKQLLATGERLGYSIGLQFNNSYTYKRSHGYRRTDTVKDVQNIPIDIGMGQREYLYCPKPAWDHFMQKDRRVLQKLNVKGFILWDGLQLGLMACYDDKHPFGMPQMAQLINDVAQRLTKEDSLAVGAVGSMDYLLPNAQGLFDHATTASNLCDQSIPLLPMIYHGLMGYSFEPTNLRQDQRREFLKLVEYGGIPNAYITEKTVERLVDAAHNPIFSGQYTAWRSTIVREYKEYLVLKSLQNQAMVDHKMLAPGVFQTLYSDGSYTVVNYGNRTYRWGRNELKPLSYGLYKP